MLSRTAKDELEKMKRRQKNAVTKVLLANDHRRPSLDSTIYAPSCVPIEKVPLDKR